MSEVSDLVLSFGKLGLTFTIMLVLLRLHVGLWLAVLSGSLVVAFTCGLSAVSWLEVALATLRQPEFLLLAVMLMGIMLLSAVQEKTGQSRRFVDGIERYLRWPRVRLVIFPALVGLLPMPGGALFSCPMLKAAAKDMAMTEEHKAIINYWFRHIWEEAWPLYPGYILTCSLLGVPLSKLWLYTFPLVLLNFATGWFFYMRPLTRSRILRSKDACELNEKGVERDSLPEAERSELEAACAAQTATPPPKLGAVLLEALPIGVTLAGAAVFATLFDLTGVEAPSQAAFILSLALAVGVALYQGRGRLSEPLLRLAFSRNSGKMLLLIYTIFIFKDTIAASGMVASLSRMGGSMAAVYLLFIILPLLCGLLTGIMVGFVGACFPILIGVLTEMNMQAETIPLIVLAMVAGNCGQLLSPLHVCMVVSCEYFQVTIPALFKKLIGPVSVQLVYGILFACVLYALGAGI